MGGGRADSSRRSRMVRQSRDDCSPTGSTRTRVPRTAPALAGCDVIWTPSMPRCETASWIVVRGTPASTRAPRIMSPLAPENGSKTAMRDKRTPQNEKAVGVSAGSWLKHSVEGAAAGPCKVLASPGKFSDVACDRDQEPTRHVIAHDGTDCKDRSRLGRPEHGGPAEAGAGAQAGSSGGRGSLRGLRLS